MIYSQTKISTLTLLIALFLSTPRIAHADQTNVAGGSNYGKVEVNGLSCPFCAYGLEKKLKELVEVEGVQIDVEAGLIFLTFKNGKHPDEKTIKAAVEDAGFTPGSILFSSSRFEGMTDD